MVKDCIIIGIDPGTNILGYGIIEIKNNKPILLTHGVLNIEKVEDPYSKLKSIFEKITHLIDEYHPDELSIEAPFFGKNVQSMLKLGRAQGVAMAAALNRSIPVFEYSPRKIKQSITGNGSSSKEQVAYMLNTLVGLKEIPKNLDATDGIAVALCHYYQSNSPTQAGKKYSGWESFINNNPQRKIDHKKRASGEAL